MWAEVDGFRIKIVAQNSFETDRNSIVTHSKSI